MDPLIPSIHSLPQHPLLVSLELFCGGFLCEGHPAAQVVVAVPRALYRGSMGSFLRLSGACVYCFWWLRSLDKLVLSVTVG
jgi:hypothetical protein